MIPLRPTSNSGGGGGAGVGGGRRPSVPLAAAAASLAPSPTSRHDLEAGRSSSDPSSATVQMLTVGGNDSDTDADSFDGDEAGGRKAGAGPDSGTRMFRKLDIRVNSIGVRLAHFLRNPRVLMAILGALLIAIVLVAVSGQDNPDKDGSYTHREPNGDIVLMHVASNEKRTLAKSQDLKDGAGNSISFVSYTVSNDLKYMLLETHRSKGWRYSYYSDFFIFDFAGKTATPLTTYTGNKAKSSDVAEGKAWVRDNDIYVTMDTTTEIRLTSDGSSDIINGVSDWVYEEEVLNSHAAMWFSSDGTKLAYLKFNDSGVPDVHLQRFFTGSAGASVYPLEAGKPNPVVTLHIATPSSSTMARRDSTVRFEDPDDLFPDEDRLIVEVKWVSSSELIVRMMNRVQDAQRLFYVTHRDSDGTDWIARKVRDETNEDESWFPRLQAITVVPPLPSLGHKNPSYIELREDDEGFTHLAYYDSATDSVPSAWLTRGSWEVTDVAAVDPQRGVVYFLSTEEGSTQRHLYSVTLDGTSKTRLSPPQNGPDWGAS
ncbi:diacylglycerol pyrophosphate phosphatase, partial [Cladochytrium tenue]